MAAAAFDPLGPLPVYLVSVRLGIYEDEHHRVWIVANVETSHSSHGNRVHLRICISRELFSPFGFFQRLSIIIHNEIVNVWVDKKQVSAQTVDKPGSC